MKNALEYRALASLCRQQAAYRPNERKTLLGQAEHWQHLAEAEIAFHFKECNATSSSDLAGHERSLSRMTRDGRRLSPREYSHTSGLAASVALKKS